MKKENLRCTNCLLREHDAYICVRWRRFQRMKDILSSIHILGRRWKKKEECPFFHQELFGKAEGK